MTAIETLEKYPILDVAVLSHGFAPYNRDYVLLIEAGWIGDAAGRYRYHFTHCAAADYETRVRDNVWPASWDDVFTDYNRWVEANEPEGYVWGVNWALAYPGWKHHPGSERARSWSERLGHDMHEISVETDAYVLWLVFHDVRVEKVSDDADLVRQVVIPLGS